MNARTFQVTFLILVFAGLLWLTYSLRAVFYPPLIALLLAYILNPFVTLLEKRKVPRLASIGVIYALFLICFALTILIAVPFTVRQGVNFVDDFFVGEEAKVKKILTAEQVEKLTGKDWKTLVEDAKGKIPEHGGDIASVFASAAAMVGTWVAGGLGALFAALSFVILIPVYLFFFLRGMNQGWEKFQEWIPKLYREQILKTLNRIHRANAAYFRGQITVCLIDGAVFFIILEILGVPFSFLFGILYAVLAMVPFIGPVGTFVIVQVVVLAESGGVFGTQFAGVCILFLGIQALEGMVLQPMILGKETGLHPVSIILSLLVFGGLFGFFGMLLAIPLWSAAQIVLQEHVLPIFREVTDAPVTPKDPSAA